MTDERHGKRLALGTQSEAPAFDEDIEISVDELDVPDDESVIEVVTDDAVCEELADDTLELEADDVLADDPGRPSTPALCGTEFDVSDQGELAKPHPRGRRPSWQPIVVR